jgi:acetyl-CoA C-acetyltransferase
VATSGVDPGGIVDLILASAAGPGGNPARRVALHAGLPVTVPGLSIDRQCGGGLDAIALACRLVEAGAGDLYVAGGVESASTSPLRHQAASDVGASGRRFFPRRMFAGGGHDDPGMAESAEVIATEWGIDRQRCDAYAAESHRRAVAARDGGAFLREIAPCEGRNGTPVTRDSCPRPTLTWSRMGRFPPIVAPDGVVTAANASQIADGAAVVIVASRERADALGAGGLLHRGSATVGTDPRVCGIGAVAAARALARRGGPDVARLAHVAMTEAFASQTVATIDELDLDAGRVNPRGGAIGLGHPWGASGAVQVVRLFADRTAGSDVLALAAIAGGMGTACWFTAEEDA